MWWDALEWGRYTYDKVPQWYAMHYSWNDFGFKAELRLVEFKISSWSEHEKCGSKQRKLSYEEDCWNKYNWTCNITTMIFEDYVWCILLL